MFLIGPHRRAVLELLLAVAPEPMAQLHEWLAPYRRLWDERLDALERHLDATEEPG